MENEIQKDYTELIVGQNEEEISIDDNKEQKDYARLIAAQNESARVLKIKEISRTLKDEYKKKRRFAIISGISFVGLLVATHFSGVDPVQALQTEFQALGSFDALKEYLEYFTPAMWGTTIATAVSISKFIKHKKRYDKANEEFYDMTDNEPKDYQDIVEWQAKNR